MLQATGPEQATRGEVVPNPVRRLTGCTLACDAYWAEDPCGPDIPQSVDLTGGDAGERRVFSIQAEPLVSSACDGGVPDGDHGGADTEGSGRNR